MSDTNSRANRFVVRLDKIGVVKDVNYDNRYDRYGRYLVNEKPVSFQVLADLVTKFVKQSDFQIRRGDVIFLSEGISYDDVGLYVSKFFWNGKKVIDQDYDESGCGAIPSEFLVPTEFTPLYWSEHGFDKVWLDMRFRDELIKSMDIRKDCVVSKFLWNGETWNVFFVFTRNEADDVKLLKVRNALLDSPSRLFVSTDIYMDDTEATEATENIEDRKISGVTIFPKNSLFDSLYKLTHEVSQSISYDVRNYKSIGSLHLKEL